MDEVAHEHIECNGVSLHVVTAGPRDGTPVVLCHGFPETWYSWRHQISVLAHAGYRVVAFDWRGYGSSSRPSKVADYGSDQLTGDLCALLDHYGYERVALVGHDWGAIVVWEMGRLHPDRVGSIFNMSVPFTQSRGAPVEAMAKVFADQFFYIVYFQTVGVAEHELEAETRLFLRNFLFSASGEGMSTGLAFGPAPREGTGLLDTLVEAPTPLPGWLSDDDVDNYTSSFNVSGFFGPLSFYRNMDANWERSRDIPPSVLAMPIGFLTGSLDPVRFMTSGAAEDMANVLPDFRGVTIIEGAGHWIQQERPEATNEALLAFLASLQ